MPTDLIVPEIQLHEMWSFFAKSKKRLQSTQAVTAEIQRLELQQTSASFIFNT